MPKSKINDLFKILNHKFIYLILLDIYEIGPVRHKQIHKKFSYVGRAKHLSIDYSALNRAIKELNEMGLIKRIIIKENKADIIVHEITPKGEKICILIQQMQEVIDS